MGTGTPAPPPNMPLASRDGNGAGASLPTGPLSFCSRRRLQNCRAQPDTPAAPPTQSPSPPPQGSEPSPGKGTPRDRAEEGPGARLGAAGALKLERLRRPFPLLRFLPLWWERGRSRPGHFLHPHPP